MSVGGQHIRSPLLESQVERANCVRVRAAPPANNLDNLVRYYGLEGLEFRELILAHQLEQLSKHSSNGSKLESRGKRVTIEEYNPLFGATSEELVRQLADWKESTNAKDYFVGRSNTPFSISVQEKVLVPSKASTDHSHVAEIREQKALLVADAWLVRDSCEREVNEKLVPQLEGCQDALLVETFSGLTDGTGTPGSVSMSRLLRASMLPSPFLNVHWSGERS